MPGTEVSQPGSTLRTGTTPASPTSRTRMAIVGCCRNGATAIRNVLSKPLGRSPKCPVVGFGFNRSVQHGLWVRNTLGRPLLPPKADIWTHRVGCNAAVGIGGGLCRRHRRGADEARYFDYPSMRTIKAGQDRVEEIDEHSKKRSG